MLEQGWAKADISKPGTFTVDPKKLFEGDSGEKKWTIKGGGEHGDTHDQRLGRTVTFEGSKPEDLGPGHILLVTYLDLARSCLALHLRGRFNNSMFI